MKILYILFALTATLCMSSTQSYAQESNARSNQLAEAAKKIREYYIFEDVANKVALKLEAAIDKKTFNNLSDKEFADSLTSFLVTHSDDRHFNVMYNPNPKREEINDKELLEEANEINRKWNYGFEKVHRLSGNIGYIEYTGFPQGNKSAQQILDATMNFVSNTHALILDLRDNRGGDGKMVQLFLSYFFKEKIQLSESYTRFSGKTSKSFTKGKVHGIKYLNKPIYILVNDQTISAAEGLAYDLQCRDKATVIGETTYGAANPIKVLSIDRSYVLFIPVTENRSTITQTNWEHTGVDIDVPIESEKALTKAHIIALEQLLSSNTETELTTEEMRAKIEELRHK